MPGPTVRPIVRWIVKRRGYLSRMMLIPDARPFAHRSPVRWAWLVAVLALVAGLSAHAMAAPARQAEPVPLTVFFLVDDSNGMAGATLNGRDARSAIQAGAGRLLDQLDMGRDRAAVVLFGDTGEIAQAPTQHRQAVLDAIGTATMRDSQARLDLGYAEVAKAIKADAAVGGKHYATVVITDMPMMDAPEQAMARAVSLRRAGVQHYVVAVGEIVNVAVLRQVAQPDGYFNAPWGGDIIGPYEQIGKLLAGIAPGAWITPVPTASPTPMPTRGASATPTSRPETGTPVASPTSPREPVFLPLAERSGRLGVDRVARWK